MLISVASPPTSMIQEMGETENLEETHTNMAQKHKTPCRLYLKLSMLLHGGRTIWCTTLLPKKTLVSKQDKALV